MSMKEDEGARMFMLVVSDQCGGYRREQRARYDLSVQQRELRGGLFLEVGVDDGRWKEKVWCQSKAGCLTGAISFCGKGICLHSPWEISFSHQKTKRDGKQQSSWCDLEKLYMTGLDNKDRCMAQYSCTCIRDRSTQIRLLLPDQSYSQNTC
jgi:hypothetical protein